MPVIPSPSGVCNRAVSCIYSVCPVLLSLCGDSVDATDIMLYQIRLTPRSLARPVATTHADATTRAVTDRDMQVLCTDMMMSNPSAAAACVMRTRVVDIRLIVCDVDGDGDGDADADDTYDADV